MKEIDNIISDQFDKVRKGITKENFQILCEFNLNEIQQLKDQTEKLKKIKGIYLFEIYKLITR